MITKLNDYINLLVCETERIESLSGEVFYKYCEIGEIRPKIWEKLETEGLAFVRSLGKKLNEKDCKSLFPDSEFSMRKHILEDIETAPFHVHGRESIDALILEFKDKLDFEAAGRLSQYQDSESLKYLFSKYSSNPDLTDFLMHLYGECVYRHPEILEDNSLLEFYEKYMIDYWGVFLPPKPSCLELTVPLVRYARTEDSMGMDAYDYETINVNEIVISKANIRECDLQPIDSVSGNKQDTQSKEVFSIAIKQPCLQI